MEAMYRMLMEFMSKVMDAVVARRHDGKRTEDERPGIRSCVSLGQWINCNKQAVKAAIANDSEMFELIMKQASQTLKTYIRTGVWNTVYWVTSYDGYFWNHLTGDHTEHEINLKIHFVWTPQNGQTMTKDEDNRLFGKMKNVANSLDKAGYDVYCYVIEWEPITPNTGDGAEKRVGYSCGNVFELLEDFLGRPSQEISKLVWQAKMEDKLQHE